MILRLQHLARDIIVLVFLAGFLEFLLPSGTMKSTMKLLVGLFVLALLLDPIVNFVEHIARGVDVDLPAVREGEISTVLKQGEDLHQEQLNAAMIQYKINIEEQIHALVQFKEGDVDIGIIVDVETNTERPDFGQILSIELKPGHGALDRNKEQLTELAMWLADFYGLDKDKVSIVCLGP